MQHANYADLLMLYGTQQIVIQAMTINVKLYYFYNQPYRVYNKLYKVVYIKSNQKLRSSDRQFF